jgi:uncharacterized glyoxalase superfamily protein PhnB
MNPFEQLRHVDRAEAPSPRFAELLRSRLEEALAPALPNVPDITAPERSNIMSTLSSAPTPVAAAAIVPYICVADAAAALDWYTSVLGAEETVRYVGDDGRIGHAELLVGGAELMLSDPFPELGVVAPDPSGSSVALHLNLPDVDAVYARAVAAGAAGLREPEDQPYGERSSTIVDPFGHRWMIQTTIAAPTTDEINEQMEGFTVVPAAPAMPSGSTSAPVEIGYVTMGFDDTAKARAFYGALFGWQTEDGHLGDQYAHVENTVLPMGMTPDGSSTPATLYFRVADAAAYGRRVVELGGSILTETAYDSGGDVVCVDDQGREFHLWQAAPGY